MWVKGICLALILLLTAQVCLADETDYALTPQAKGASGITAQKNREVYETLDFSDEREMEFAARGLICAPESLELVDAEGKVIWSQDAYAFLEEEAPDTANPSLWRNTRMNHLYGLFEVVEGIYQVRGYDMSNITFIKGDTGWIVFDPLMSVECAQAAEEIRAGDQVDVDFSTGVIIDTTQGKTWQAAPFPAFIDGIIQSGGLLNSLKARGVAK